MQLLPELPRLIHQALQPRAAVEQRLLEALIGEQRRTRRALYAVICVGTGLALGVAGSQLWLHWR